jgi:hypothetical protein
MTASSRISVQPLATTKLTLSALSQILTDVGNIILDPNITEQLSNSFSTCSLEEAGCQAEG